MEETDMENEDATMNWGFRQNKALHAVTGFTIGSVLKMINEHLDKGNSRPVIPLGHGDPSWFPSFRTSIDAENAVAHALYSAQYNSYASHGGILPARTAIADYLSRDLPYQLSSDDVFITSGCNQAIEVVLAALATPGANILLPKPSYPLYNARAAFQNLEFRHFELIPEKRWEIDLDGLEAIADKNTVAMVLINPGNPCGSVYTFHHLKKVAETAKKLGILVVSDEVYAHLTFGDKPFIPMGVFGSIVPVLTLGSLSKRWIVPGWRLGWIATTDPNGILTKNGIVEALMDYLIITTCPATFIQGAVPQILEKTSKSFFSNINDVLRKDADLCCFMMKDIPCIDFPYKSEGSMFLMVKLNLSMLEDILDDTDFCVKLSKEESVIVMPGAALGMKNWLRITFAVEPPCLQDGLMRFKLFCERHAKKK